MAIFRGGLPERFLIESVYLTANKNTLDYEILVKPIDIAFSNEVPDFQVLYVGSSYGIFQNQYAKPRLAFACPILEVPLDVASLLRAVALGVHNLIYRDNKIIVACDQGRYRSVIVASLIASCLGEYVKSSDIPDYQLISQKLGRDPIDFVADFKEYYIDRNFRVIQLHFDNFGSK